MEKIDTDDGFGELIEVSFSEELEVDFTIETRKKDPSESPGYLKKLGETTMYLSMTLAPLVIALMLTLKTGYDPYSHVSGWWLMAHLTALIGLGYFGHREKAVPMFIAIAALYLVAINTGINPARFLGQHLGTYGWILGFCLVIPSALIGAIISHAEEGAKPA